jgi:DNA invertase Pin-like site-specific DNA recombinase
VSNKTIQNSGAHLVSTTEAISATPSGRLMHVIMASIAELFFQGLVPEPRHRGDEGNATKGHPKATPGGHRSVVSMSGAVTG